MNEWTLAGEVVSYINSYLERTEGLPFSRARVERRAAGGRKRHDVYLDDRRGTPVLTGELKVPDAPELVTSIADYRAYGITKLRQILGPLQDGDWPLAYRDGADLVVSLIQSQNFFQFPAIVRDRTAIAGGHALTVDIFSFPNFQNQVFAGLRAITVTGSPADTSLQTGDQTTLQGFFSINLRVALDHAGTATTEVSAVHVPEALEFFVFGRTGRKALVNCGS